MKKIMRVALDYSLKHESVIESVFNSDILDQLDFDKDYHFLSTSVDISDEAYFSYWIDFLSEEQTDLKEAIARYSYFLAHMCASVSYLEFFETLFVPDFTRAYINDAFEPITIIDKIFQEKHHFAKRLCNTNDDQFTELTSLRVTLIEKLDLSRRIFLQLYQLIDASLNNEIEALQSKKRQAYLDAFDQLS